MVTEAVMGVFATVISWIVGWLPSNDPPAWVGDVGSGFQVAFNAANTMGAWLPVRLGFAVAGTVLACLVAGFTIKLIRSIASYFLAGGGSSG